MFLLQWLQRKRKEFPLSYLYFAEDFLTSFLGHLALLEFLQLTLLQIFHNCLIPKERGWNFLLMSMRFKKFLNGLLDLSLYWLFITAIFSYLKFKFLDLDVIIMFLFFFSLRFLSQPFNNHRTARKGGGHFFNWSLPFPSASQTLGHQSSDYCRQLTSAHRQKLDSNREPLASERNR